VRGTDVFTLNPRHMPEIPGKSRRAGVAPPPTIRSRATPPRPCAGRETARGHRCARRRCVRCSHCTSRLSSACCAAGRGFARCQSQGCATVTCSGESSLARDIGDAEGVGQQLHIRVTLTSVTDAWATLPHIRTLPFQSSTFPPIFIQLPSNVWNRLSLSRSLSIYNITLIKPSKLS